MAVRGDDSKLRSRQWIKYLAVIGVVAALAVVGSAFQRQIGLAKPDEGAVALVGATTDVHRALGLGASYEEFAALLRVALAAERTFAIDNAADAEVRRYVSPALDCYAVIRESWQAELEDGWDPDSHGDPAYWQALHPDVDLGSVGGELDHEAIRTECAARALEHLERAVEVVGG